MLILVSSSARKRYHDDILRCLAAPEGAEVQFRYSKADVAQAVWQNPKTIEGQEGVVCSADVKVSGSFPLIPVRTVKVRRMFRHGTIATVVLAIGKLAYADDINTFTETIHKKGAEDSPKKVVDEEGEPKITGKFFFQVDSVGHLHQDAFIDNWQGIVKQLHGQQGYSKEPFFWTVLGLYETAPASGEVVQEGELKKWNPNVTADGDYTLLVYIYHPCTSQWDNGGTRLRLTTHPPVITNYPHDVVIDSPYDVKRWRFRITSSHPVKCQRGWFSIGGVTGKPRNPDDSIPDWEIDLPVNVHVSPRAVACHTLLVGVLLAMPAILNILYQRESGEYIAAVGLSIGAVLMASLGVFVSFYRLWKPT